DLLDGSAVDLPPVARAGGRHRLGQDDAWFLLGTQMGGGNLVGPAAARLRSGVVDHVNALENVQRLERQGLRVAGPDADSPETARRRSCHVFGGVRGRCRTRIPTSFTEARQPERKSCSLCWVTT